MIAPFKWKDIPEHLKTYVLEGLYQSRAHMATLSVGHIFHLDYALLTPAQFQERLQSADWDDREHIVITSRATQSLIIRRFPQFDYIKKCEMVLNDEVDLVIVLDKLPAYPGAPRNGNTTKGHPVSFERSH